MARFTPFRGKLALENTDFNRKIDQSGKHVQKFAKDTQQSLDGSTKSAKQLSTEILAMSAAAVGSIGLVVNKLKELEADLLLVQYAWTDMGNAGRDAVRLIAQEQAKLTGSAVADVVKVQTALSNQGIDPRTARGQALTNVVSNFADATGKSHAGVIDSLSPGSIATGASHQRLLDVYAAVGQRSRGGIQGGFDLLGQFMPALAPTGQALGLDETELAALLGTASWHTPRARRAGSGIRMVLEEAVKPDSKFAKAFADTFEQSLEEAVGGRGLVGLIEAFERALTTWGDRGFISSFGSAETGALAKAVVGDQQRLQQMLRLAEDSEGAAARINEQYENTLKQTAGVLSATFESAQLSLGEMFRPEAVEWMKLLTEILDNDKLVEATGALLESATLIAGPLKDLVVPLADFTAAILSFAGNQNIVGELDLLDLAFAAALTRPRRTGGKQQPQLKMGGVGVGAALSRLLPAGAKTASKWIGKGVNVGTHLLIGKALWDQANTSPEGDALDEAVMRQLDAFQAGVLGEPKMLIDKFGKDAYINMMQMANYMRKGETIGGDPFEEKHFANIMSHLAEEIGPDVLSSVFAALGLHPGALAALQGDDVAMDVLKGVVEVDDELQKVRDNYAEYGRQQLALAEKLGLLSDAVDDTRDHLGRLINDNLNQVRPSYQLQQQHMLAALAPSGFDAAKALQFASGDKFGTEATRENWLAGHAARKVIEEALARGGWTDQERGIKAVLELYLSDMAKTMHSIDDSNEGIEDALKPQRDYRVQLDVIESADQLLVGG